MGLRGPVLGVFEDVFQGVFQGVFLLAAELAKPSGLLFDLSCFEFRDISCQTFQYLYLLLGSAVFHTKIFT